MPSSNAALKDILSSHNLALPDRIMATNARAKAIYRGLCPYGRGFASEISIKLEHLVTTCIQSFSRRSTQSRPAFWEAIREQVIFFRKVQTCHIREFTLALITASRRRNGRGKTFLDDTIDELSVLLAQEAVLTGGDDEATALARELEVINQRRILVAVGRKMKATCLDASTNGRDQHRLSNNSDNLASLSLAQTTAFQTHLIGSTTKPSSSSARSPPFQKRIRSKELDGIPPNTIHSEQSNEGRLRSFRVPLTQLPLGSAKKRAEKRKLCRDSDDEVGTLLSRKKVKNDFAGDDIGPV